MQMEKRLLEWLSTVREKTIQHPAPPNSKARQQKLQNPRLMISSSCDYYGTWCRPRKDFQLPRAYKDQRDPSVNGPTNDDNIYNLMTLSEYLFV